MFDRIHVWILLASLLAIGFLPAAEPAGEAPGNGRLGKLILDERAYWRTYVEFGIDRISPELLKTQAEAILGKSTLKRLPGSAKRWLRPPFGEKLKAANINTKDWRDFCYFNVVISQFTSHQDAAFFASTPPPPDGWQNPDFDDGDWVRERIPVGMGRILEPGGSHGENGARLLGFRRSIYRSTFTVRDPEQADGYRLQMRFRGGARVFINGVELKRAFLPEGELGDDAGAQPYAKDAYLRMEDEAPKGRHQAAVKRTGVDFCPDLFDTFELADQRIHNPKIRKRAIIEENGKVFLPQATRRGGHISKKGFERLKQLRDRRLGPVTIPAKLLRKGNNSIAIEIRSADLNPVVATRGWNCGETHVHWSHCRLIDIAIHASSAQAPSSLTRPKGVQVWVEDPNRRCFSDDFGDENGKTGTLRFVGARNGEFSGLVALATDQELSALDVETSVLRNDKGDATLPASVIRVEWMRSEPASEFAAIGQYRCFAQNIKTPSLTWAGRYAFLRYGPDRSRTGWTPTATMLDTLAKIEYFDAIHPNPPERLAANRCQPIWFTLCVPNDARPGIYKGSVTVKAKGMQPVSVPVEAEVTAWRLPDPKDSQVITGLEQSPYGVAKHYKTGLWTDAHFKALEGSFKQLGRVGNTILHIPCISYTEFGNNMDTLIQWIRKKDGSLAFDYTNLDRYLDLATRHWKSPRFICFGVLDGAEAARRKIPSVKVVDESSGKSEVLELKPGREDYEANWRAFVTALHSHMQARGLADSMYWGFEWDVCSHPMLKLMFNQWAPDIKWMKGSHPLAFGEAITVCSTVYAHKLGAVNRYGWQESANIGLLNPRRGGGLFGSDGCSPPFTFRLMTDRALAGGLRGVTRMGADFWSGAYREGFSGAAWAMPGMPCIILLWPGEQGAVPGQRFEVFREGVQEGEARIFIEEALKRGILPEKLAARVKEVSLRHYRETLYIPASHVHPQLWEYLSGWRDRSRRLYRTAAEVAQFLSFDLDTTRIEKTIPPGRDTVVSVQLRNWTEAPRAWKANAEAEWIVPEATTGKLTGRTSLAVKLDARRLKPGTKAEGKLILTDTESGKRHEVTFSVTVAQPFSFVTGKAYDFLGRPGHAGGRSAKRIHDHAVFNVVGGKPQTRTFTFSSHMPVDVAWKADASVPWLSAESASGTLKPFETIFLRVTVATHKAQAMVNNATLTFREVKGTFEQKAQFKVYAIPGHTAPQVPKGKVVPLSSVAEELTTLLHGPSYRCFKRVGRKLLPFFGKPDFMKAWMPYDLRFGIGGKGFSAFSTKVRVAETMSKNRAYANLPAYFEVHVDGKLRAQSGPMKAADDPRLLVVKDLEKAKELRLFVRFELPVEKNGRIRRMETRFIEPRFYQP